MAANKSLQRALYAKIMDDILIKLTEPDAKLAISEDKYLERPDVCPDAIYIVGNYSGFIALMHNFLHAANELQDELVLSDLSFISSDLKKPLIATIEYGENVDCVNTGILLDNKLSFEWSLTEATLDRVAGSSHGPGYAYSHLHFDPKNTGASHAIFCTIE